MVDESDIGGRIFGLSIWDLLFGELDISILGICGECCLI